MDLPAKVKEIGRQHGHNMKNVDLIVTLYNNSAVDFQNQLAMQSLLATCFSKVCVYYIN